MSATTLQRSRRIIFPEEEAAARERAKKLAARDALREDLARKRLINFTTWTMPDYRVNWHHNLVASELDKFIDGETTRLMLFMPPRHGKALEIRTPIATPNGWVEIGELRVGDYVFNEHGLPVRVVAVSPRWENRPLYRVTTDSGQSVLADAAHEWMVRLERKRPQCRTRWETQGLYERSSPRRPMVDKSGPLGIKDRGLSIDPYTLGVWLGDGCTHHATITGKGDDLSWIRKRVSVSYVTSDRGTADTFGVIGLSVLLRTAGLLGNKHVPDEYLWAGPSQRLALLQGLIDTDGHVAPDGQVEFCSTVEPLAQAVRHLVVSLGYKASLVMGAATLQGRLIGPKWRVMFYMPDAASIPRKRTRCIVPTRTPDHYLSIEPAGSGTTVCIEVDSQSHLFLAGYGLIPTCNSELSSKRLPALAFGKNPDLNIIACSYSADLAERVSRDVQRIMDTEKYRALFPETQLGEYGGRTIRRNDIFEIAGKRGVYRAAGVRGGIGGMGADIAIIDDPIKDRLQAESEIYREAVWEWFTSTLFMRLERRGRLLLTLTRWHHDDIAGRLLRLADEGLLGSTPWKVICLRGIREDEPLDYDPRQPGEALWPWKKSAKSIYDIKSLNSYDYEALFQQRPTAAEGALFKREWFKTYTCTSEVLNGERVVCYNVPQPDGTAKKWLRSKLTRFVTIDLAMSLKTSADYTVLAHWGLTPDARLLLLELERVRLEGPDHEAMVKRHWLSQKPSLIGIESVQYQSTLAKSLARQGLPCIELKPDRDKYARAIPAAAMAEALGVWVPEAAPWLAAFVQEHLEFPRGTHDDMVDCLSYAAWIVSNRLSSAASLPIGVGKTSYWR